MHNMFWRIKNFIEGFKLYDPKEVEDIFTYGNCYYFAIILKSKFKGDIAYLPIANHFIFKFRNHYFDITGELDPKIFEEDVYLWDDYCGLYPEDCKKIIRDCVDLENRMS